MLGSEGKHVADVSIIPHHIAEEFEEWVNMHGKNYAGEEKNMRMKVYYENYNFVEEFNANEENTFTVGLNKFADITNEEYVSLYLGNKDSFIRKRKLNTVILEETNEATVDWRKKNAVTPVKD